MSERGNNKPVTLFLFVYLGIAMMLFGHQSHAQAIPGDSIVPLTLEQAIELGVENSYKLKAANLATAIADENIKQKKTDRLPGLDVGIDAYLINDPILYNETPFSDPQKIDYTPYQLTGTLMVSEVIYAGNRIKNSINQEVLQKKIAEFSAVKTSTDAKMTIISEYLKLFTLVKNYEVNIQTINQIELRLKTLRSKFINGQVVKNDVSRSELQKADYELRLLHNVNLASATNYFLTLLLGLPENVIIRVDTSINYTSDTLFVFQDLLQTALDNRPEFQIAKTNKELAVNTFNLVKGAYYPTINAVGLYGLQNPIPGTFPPEGKFLSYLTVGAGINYSIASLYKTSHQKSASELAIQLEQENINDMQVKISDNVRTQFLQYELERQSLDIYEDKVRFAEENYKIIQSRYYNDLALISDMVDAELEYSQARLDLIKGQVQTREEYYKMLKAIGKL